MLNNITLGQYYPVDSIVHRLDPRMKLILTIAYIVAVFLAKSFIGYALLLGWIILVSRLSCVPFKLVIKGLKPLRIIIILTFLLNLFMTPGETIWISFWIVRITKEAFLQALFYSLRLAFLVAGTSLLTLTTSPIALSDGIELLLSPLKKIRFPAHELAMMMTIALRFIPTLLEETDKIMNAQKARGADMESGSIFRRIKALIPVLIPLFVSSFRRANDLAMAMECRCYNGGKGRTRMRIPHFSWLDLWGLLFSLVMFTGVVLCNVYFPPLVR